LSQSKNIRLPCVQVLAILVWGIFILQHIPALSQPKIQLVYPQPGQQVLAADSSFIFGNVWPKSASVRINGKEAKVYRNGAFMGYVPVKNGNFVFHCQAIFDDDTTTVVREVYVPFYLKSSTSEALLVDTSYIFPRANWELQPGDVFKVAVKGTPGCKATFSIEGLIEDFPMTELQPTASYYWGDAIFGQGITKPMIGVKGIYIGSYIIQAWDWAQQRKISFKLTNADGKEKSATAAGRLSVDLSAIPKIVQLKNNVIRPRGGMRIGSQLFLPQGSKILAASRRGDHVRCLYHEKNDIWIHRQNLEFLPPGSAVPKGIITSIRVSGDKEWALIEIDLDQKLPFRVEQVLRPTQLDLTFYGIDAGTDSVRLEMNDPLIRDIRWQPTGSDAYSFQINLAQDRHWGYDPFYENGKFYLKIKKKPQIARWPHSPLKNIVICLDPGHSPDLGAVGAMGIPEKDINFDYCMALKNQLEDKGALVFLTRGKQDGITLQARAELARHIGAEILISFHFNGIPDGVDPFKIRGVSSYYNQPHSYLLASILQNHLVKASGLSNFGLYYSNLAICRTPQMISVLLEPGFLTHPLEEMLILSASYQQKIVKGVVNGLEQFLKQVR